MKFSVASVLLTLGVSLPCIAHAQSAVWGDEGGCQRVAGQAATTDMVFILWPDRIERYESSCGIVSAEAGEGSSTVIRVQCSGEGETWEDAYAVEPAGEGLRIWPLDAPGFVSDLRRCE